MFNRNIKRRRWMCFCLKWWILSSCGLLGCATTGEKIGKRPPREAREALISYNYGSYKHPIYRVLQGDNLTRIAWLTGTTIEKLAAANQLTPPYVLQVNQCLRIPAAIARGESISSKSCGKTPPKSQGASASLSTVASQPAYSTPSNKRFRWPAVGKRRYILKTKDGVGAHLRIFGKRGCSVVAAASGRVMYAGSGLHGYGNLVIMKHDETYISAYANNEKILVKEGEWIQVGQRIATMGSTASDQVYLHFELRKRGEPVNPFDYIVIP